MASAPSICHPCGQPVIWARTPGGTSLPFDPEPGAPSAWALKKDTDLRYYARPLQPGAQPVPGAEHRHAMHFDTCPQREQIGNRHD